MYSRKIKFILFIILIGVGAATVSDMDLNFVGSMFGAFAVIFTAQFQILQGENQKLLQMNASQINHANAPSSCIFCAILAFCFETGLFPIGESDQNVLTHEFQEYEIATIFASCILAALVNLTSYGLIGKTSSITYQVIGHAKTCLILVTGYLFFPPVNQSTSQLVKNVLGIFVAMIGVVLYGHTQSLESQNPKPLDLLDRHFPTWLLEMIEGSEKTLPTTQSETTKK